MDQRPPALVLSITHVPASEIPRRGPGRPRTRLGAILHNCLLVSRQEAVSLREGLEDTCREVNTVRCALDRLTKLELILSGLEERVRRIENHQGYIDRLEI